MVALDGNPDSDRTGKPRVSFDPSAASGKSEQKSAGRAANPFAIAEAGLGSDVRWHGTLEWRARAAARDVGGLTATPRAEF
jgi:hypothetical protein